MRKFLLFGGLWVCILSNFLLGQGFQSPKDWSAALRQAPKLNVGLDTRHSFISSRDVSTAGIKVSLDFENRLRFGYGVYFLFRNRVFRDFTLTDSLGNAYTVKSELRFSYLSAFAEYVFFLNERWEFSAPASLGVGDVGFRNVDQEKKAVLLTEVGVMGSYKIFPFFGLGGGIGYRQILVGGNLLRDNFNSPTYSFGLRFWVGYLYKKYIQKSL